MEEIELDRAELKDLLKSLNKYYKSKEEGWDRHDIKGAISIIKKELSDSK